MPAAPASAKPAITDEASAPPPTWTTTRSSRGGPVGPADRGRQLAAERLAALDREAVQVALAGERDGAVGDRVEQREVGRVAGDARLALADGELRAERPKPRHDDGVGVGRDEDVEVAVGGARDDRGGEGGVAAGGDREAAPSSGRAPPRLLHASSSSVPNRWRALCEPDTLPVSSLTQTPPAGEARGRRRAPRSGRTA